MKKLSVIIFSSLILGIAHQVHAESGNEGMSECISLSVQAALDAYASKYKLTTIPNISISESTGTPSNDIDIMVTINSQKIYYIIATPSIIQNKLKGCLNAEVGYIE